MGSQKLFLNSVSFVLAVTLLNFSSAFAELPFLTKSSGSGFVPPDYRRYERCDVYADRVVITKSFGDLVTIEKRNFNFQGEYKAIIQRAISEKEISTPNGLCDGPSSTTALVIDEANQVMLQTTGGCGRPSIVREGSASQIFKDLADSHCPRTFLAPGSN